MNVDRFWTSFAAILIFAFFMFFATKLFLPNLALDGRFVSNRTQWMPNYTIRRKSQPSKSSQPICLGSSRFEYDERFVEPSRCLPGVRVLVFVPSSHREARVRHVIRSTWLNGADLKRLNVRAVFLVGSFGLSQRELTALRTESDIHRDIVALSIKDTYSNLTVKTVSGVNWSLTRCPFVQHTMKVDQDTFVHLNLFVTHFLPQLEDGTTITTNKWPSLAPLSATQSLLNVTVDGSRSPKNNGTSPTARGQRASAGGEMYCWLSWSNAPVRESGSPWYVSRSVYPGDKYPNYCQGAVYLMSRRAVQGLSRAACDGHLPPLPLEDVYLGLCAAWANVSLVASSVFGHPEVRYTAHKMAAESVLTAHLNDGSRLTQLWENFTNFGYTPQ